MSIIMISTVYTLNITIYEQHPYPYTHIFRTKYTYDHRRDNIHVSTSIYRHLKSQNKMERGARRMLFCSISYNDKMSASSCTMHTSPMGVRAVPHPWTYISLFIYAFRHNEPTTTTHNLALAH